MALKMPKIQLGPKPRKWDLVALATVLLAAALAVFNWTAARQTPGTAPSDGLTSTMALAQLGICAISLLVLGKTAKEGTLWGNLAAVGGMLAGLTGVLLAAALWVGG